MKKKIVKFLLSGSLFLSLQAHSQTLLLDSLYGTNGKSVFNTINNPDYIRMFDLQNGYVLHTGYNFSAINDSHIDLFKADYCGIPDSTFGVNGLSHHKFSFMNTLYNAGLQSDGKILTCGMQSPSNAASEQIPYVARFLANGSPDTTFGTAGSVSLRFDPVASGRFGSVTQLSDGRVVCTGLSYNNINGGISGFGAMRFFADGSMDTTFSGDGKELYVVPVAAGLNNGYVTSNLDVIHVAAYRTNSNVTQLGAVCWDSTGAIKASFGAGGVFFDSTDAVTGDVFSFRDANGGITMISIKTGVSFQSLMIRITAAGVPDPAFGTGGKTVLFHPSLVDVKGIRQMPNGQILVIGQSNTGGGCMMLNSNGSVDSTFGNMGYMPADLDVNAGTHYARDMQILPNGQWLFGGNGPGFVSSRYDDVSNVPHITQNVSFLSTTGSGSYQWFLNGNAIAGATHDTLHFNQNGSYTVLLTGDYGCTYLSDPFVVTNSGIAEVAFKKLTMVPNPAHHNIRLTLTSDGSKVVISTPDGRVVKTVSVAPGIGQVEIDLSDFDSGVYIVEERSITGVAVGRLIKQ